MPTDRLAPEAAAFYRAHSAFSDPGALGAHYAGLPADPERLAGVTRGLAIHRTEGGIYSYDIPADRLHDDAETRYVDDILRIVTGRNDAPLTLQREPEDRFVGVCRDFSLLHCSFLRHAGVPARLRVGFADYFHDDGFHVDHVVTEYWDEERGWLLADAQLTDPVVGDVFEPGFDPLDVPRDRFLVAGAAWQAIRAGEADPASFGFAPGSPLAGEWFVGGYVRLDLAALNKSETLLWDVWGADADSDAALTAEIRALYDEVAALTAGPDVPFDAARALFTDHDGLRTPRTVRSLAPFNGPREVTLRG
ncbi:transglutaminase-like domain-containing protein [Streptomyces johnsoniae]|uniref:Transglutaminase-like domain-containing protein n=1 Tax=Streptomyces johnsoniae TaxID=3075532 RepID=A0ABU2S7C9_9ACTN|nr:transglutaminase-like domain-containing protein [Streptomyces sp. DSM 41886]MDT0444878.1 transglutaminase-like domain-containing protein [Streptomyces sp. DSM 41886]